MARTSSPRLVEQGGAVVTDNTATMPTSRHSDDITRSPSASPIWDVLELVSATHGSSIAIVSSSTSGYGTPAVTRSYRECHMRVCKLAYALSARNKTIARRNSLNNCCNRCVSSPCLLYTSPSPRDRSLS
eukprot:6618233-Pyramimonas_sp.AAC.2